MDKQAYIIKIAKELITNYNLPSRYKIKLQHAITTNKLRYEANYMRSIKISSSKSALRKVFGTASQATKVIRITSLCWIHHNNDMRLVDYQIKHTMVHEIDHILSGNSLHPEGLVAYSARITALLGNR
jgi:SPX domain protein involved in polyphosphate accumulation